MTNHSSAVSTSAVMLRALEPEDLDMLYNIENDPCLWQYGVTTAPYSRYMLKQYIATASADIYVDKQVRLIAQKTDGTVVGIVDLANFDPQNCRAEVGIVVMNDHRRQGLGLMALRQLIDYCHTITHLRQLYAVVSQTNEAAIHLFHKAGFYTGATLKNWLYSEEKHHDAVLMQYFLQKNG